MTFLRVLFFSTLIISTGVQAASSESGFGLNVGIGVPFLTQAGVNYKFSDSLSFSAEYNLLDLDVGTAGAKLSMPEIMVNYHPFGGSFFLGGGIGQESLEVTGTEVATNTQIKVEVEAMTAIAKLGWMWGIADKGFWFGVDVGYIMPLSPKRTITAPGVPTTDPNYQDALDAADKFGKTSYPSITFARLGYIF